MTAFFATLSLSLVLFHFGVTDFSAVFGPKLQTFCQNLLPPTKFTFAYDAMVCGVDLKSRSVRSDLLRTGLLHIFVVSGAHLVFLSQLLSVVFTKRSQPLTGFRQFIIATILTGYALLTGFCPPVVRSLFSMWLTAYSRHQKLFWRSYDQTLWCGLICLLIFPAWWGSISFLLSWIASLGLALGQGPLRQATIIYLLLIFPLFGWGINDPFAIIINWLIAPVLGLFLFPMCLLAIVIPPATFFVDYLWESFFFLLTPLAKWLTPPMAISRTPLFACWIFLFLIHFAATFWKSHQRQQNLCL